jgi:uncharacterized membrane protein YkoI
MPPLFRTFRTFRTFRYVVAVSSATLILGACGGQGLGDSERHDAERAALDAVGAGRVTEVDAGDDDDGYAYEVEVTRDGGKDVDVQLDEDFQVLNQDEIDRAREAESAPSSSAPPTRKPDDDTPLTGATLRQATRAALAETGGGDVTEATYADRDDREHTYEVEVQVGPDEDVTVELDGEFRVVRVDR